MQVEQLWTNVALNRRNVVPVLDFLIARGDQECNTSDAAQVLAQLHASQHCRSAAVDQVCSTCVIADCMETVLICVGQDPKVVETYLTVAKRIVLYLARAAAQQTIDHLVTEAARLLNEPEDPPPAASMRAAAAAADAEEQARDFAASPVPTNTPEQLLKQSSSDCSGNCSVSQALTARAGALRQVLVFSDAPQWPQPAAPEQPPFPEPTTSRRPSLSISRASSSISARFGGLHTSVPRLSHAV